MKKRVVLVYGPTASGKSALALEMAERERGVIINADSMQLYDALPLLTAQPNATECGDVPHRLYGTLAPNERASAGRWRAMAEEEIKAALQANLLPILVGGTGFYIKALTEGLSPIPAVPDQIRQSAEKMQKDLGNPAFHQALVEKDPVMAARLSPNDTQRLVRAWEVLEATGKSLSFWQSLPPEEPPSDWAFAHHFINPARADLYARCDARFDSMLEQGVLDEVRAFSALIDSGAVPEDAPVAGAIGFRPLRDFIRGRCTLEEAAAKARQETRNYAKRQITWFKNQLNTV